MTKITERKAADLSADETRDLLNWRDWTHEGLVYGLRLQTLLDRYHASGKYVSLEAWLEEEKDAVARYKRITGHAPFESE